MVVHPADNEFGQSLCYRINVFIKNAVVTLTSCALRTGSWTATCI